MIDFVCPHCQQHLFFEDSAAGRNGRCSSCRKVVRVPFPVSPAVPPRQIVEARPASSRPAADNRHVRLVCPSCKEKLVVSISKAGQVGPCPSCGQKIRVPLEAPPPEAVIDEREIVEADYDKTSAPPVRRQTYVHVSHPAEKVKGFPRFIRDGVLVQCPDCRGVHRVGDHEYGDKIPCECGADFRVTVAPQGRLYLSCRLCGCKMEIDERMAGRTVACTDCEEAVTVPSSPIRVLLIGRKRPPSASSMSTAGALLTTAAVLSSLGGRRYGGRRCLSCGRHVRNPSPYCRRCRPG